MTQPTNLNKLQDNKADLDNVWNPDEPTLMLIRDSTPSLYTFSSLRQLRSLINVGVGKMPEILITDSDTLTYFNKIFSKRFINSGRAACWCYGCVRPNWARVRLEHGFKDTEAQTLYYFLGSQLQLEPDPLLLTQAMPDDQLAMVLPDDLVEQYDKVQRKVKLVGERPLKIAGYKHVEIALKDGSVLVINEYSCTPPNPGRYGDLI